MCSPRSRAGGWCEGPFDPGRRSSAPNARRCSRSCRTRRKRGCGARSCGSTVYQGASPCRRRGGQDVVCFRGRGVVLAGGPTVRRVASELAALLVGCGLAPVAPRSGKVGLAEEVIDYNVTVLLRVRVVLKNRAKVLGILQPCDRLVGRGRLELLGDGLGALGDSVFA